MTSRSPRLNHSPRQWIVFVAILTILASRSVCSAADLVGWWTFKDGTGNDRTGNFGITHLSNATITRGQLIVSAPNGGYAWTDSYKGPAINAKTLVCWLYLNDLDAGGGSAMTLEIPGNPLSASIFDGIVFGENTPRVWTAGSDNWYRTQLPPLGTPETATPHNRLKMAIVYGADNSITVYRNGVVYTQYTQGTLQTYSSSSTPQVDVLFGRRASVAPFGQPSFLSGRIEEARLYNSALTAAEVAGLEESTGAVLGSLTVSPGVIAGGWDAQGTVRLSAASPLDTLIDLSTSSDDIRTPYTVLIPAGSTSVSFPILTGGVSETTPVMLMASLGSQSVSGTFTLVTNPADLTVTNATGTVGKSVHLSARLLGGTSPFSGQTLTFAIENVPVGTAVTNSSGVATLTYTVADTFGSGAKHLSVFFNGAVPYGANSDEGILRILRAPTTIHVTNPSGSVSHTVLLTGKLTAGSVGITGRILTFQIDGVAVGRAATDASGQATKAYKIPAGLSVGAHKLAMQFAGDLSYMPGSGTGTLTVTQ